MKTHVILIRFVIPALVLFTVIAAWAPALSAETIQYSCSAQVYEAFGDELTDLFTRETGIKVETYISSSRSAVRRLVSNFSDIASTTRSIYAHYDEYGYVQIPLCKDPLAVIANKSVAVTDISSAQLKSIFSKVTTNWQDVGGMVEPIVVVIPGRRTGAFENFDRQIMPMRKIRYDFMAYRSTMAIRLVKNFPASIAFIGYGAARQEGSVKILNVDGRRAGESDYPYYQILSLVTKGEPVGAVRKFVDFAGSENVRQLIVNRGMVPIP